MNKIFNQKFYFTLIITSLICLHYCSVNAIRISEYLRRHNIRKIRIHRSILDTFLLKDKPKTKALGNDLVGYDYKDTKVIGPKHFCRDKDDEGQYAHTEDCHKYWHCLYVGTIFEIALERKCPIGTMFHPLERDCEISTMITCSSWRRSIYGDSYVEPEINKITDEYLTNYYLQEFQRNMLAKKDFYTSTKSNGYKPEDQASYLPLLTQETTKTKTDRTTTTKTALIVEKLLTTMSTVGVKNTTEEMSTRREADNSFNTMNSDSTADSLGINFSPLDELLIEKISYLKANKLNKTQMANHLNLIKHIFEFKNKAHIEVPKDLEPNQTTLLQMYIDDKTQKITNRIYQTSSVTKKSDVKNGPRFRHAPQVNAKKYIVNEFDNESEWSLLPDYKHLNSLKKTGIFNERQRLKEVGHTTKANDLKSSQLTAEQMALDKLPINQASTIFVWSNVTILLCFFAFILSSLCL